MKFAPHYIAVFVCLAISTVSFADDPVAEPLDDLFGGPAEKAVADDPFGDPVDDPFGEPADEKPADEKPVDDDPFGAPVDDDPFGKPVEEKPADDPFGEKPTDPTDPFGEKPTEPSEPTTDPTDPFGPAVDPPVDVPADELAPILKQLSAGKTPEKLSAINQLGPRQGADAARAVTGLSNALEDDDNEVVWQAARRLGDFGALAAPAVPALTAKLSSDDSKIKAYSVFALGRIGEAAKPAAAEIVALATDEDALVRRAAIRTLRTIKPDRALTIPLFTKALQEADQDQIMPILHTLAEQGPEVVPVLREALAHKEASYWAMLVLSEIGADAADATPELVSLLSHENAEYRAQAVMTLGDIGPAAKAAVPAIVNSLETDEWSAVRYASAYSLGRIGDKSADPAIRAAGRGADFFQSVTCGWALAKLNPDNEQIQQAAIKLFVIGLGKDDPNIRRASARALFELKASGEDVAPKLIAALDDADPEVVGNVLNTIVSFEPTIVDQLLDGLKDEDLRLYVVRVVYRFGPDAKNAVPALIEALETDDDDNEFRAAAQFALGRIGPASAPATELLTKSIESDNADVRSSALYALAKIGPAAKSAAPTLMKGMASEDENQKLLAVWALTKIDPTHADLADQAIPMLIGALEHSREYVRVEAAVALGEFGAKATAATTALEAAQKDESEAVQAAAKAALAQIAGE